MDVRPWIDGSSIQLARCQKFIVSRDEPDRKVRTCDVVAVRLRLATLIFETKVRFSEGEPGVPADGN